jgi:hypothetical protein
MFCELWDKTFTYTLSLKFWEGPDKSLRGSPRKG